MAGQLEIVVQEGKTRNLSRCCHESCISSWLHIPGIFQVVLGTAYYSGNAGVLKDSEEALRWLTKAANQLSGLPPSLLRGIVRLSSCSLVAEDSEQQVSHVLFPIRIKADEAVFEMAYLQAACKM